MGRPPRPPGGEKKHIWFSARQLQLLNALRETAPLGAPPFQTIVEKAIDAFIATELERPGVRESVASYVADTKVVNIRELTKNRGK